MDSGHRRTGRGAMPDGRALQTHIVAEHWESVDWVRVYQSFGLLPDTDPRSPLST